MASVFIKRGTFWARLKGVKVPGKWGTVPTYETDRARAERFAREAQKAIDKRNSVNIAASITLRDWVRAWLEKRREAEHDWKKDRGRLVNHVLPVMGDLELGDITTARIAELVHALRFKKKLAQRTTRNVYSVLAAVLRDAAIAEKIPTSPCLLTEAQLGPIVDKNPEWRDGALFTREEAQALISDPRIPFDRQMVYAFGVLAGLRPGEAAALRWRHYNAKIEPLGKLQVSLSYSTSRSKTKRTKTEAVRSVPVHPTLAEMLTEWRRSGWEAMMGCAPADDDLIIPLPPDVKRTRRTGERFRGWDYTGRRWRELDLLTLGWRHRSVYDTKSTFITLAIEDGANRAILRERVTHTKPRRDAFDGYDRGLHWVETCGEVAKLNIERLATTLRPAATNSNETASLSGSGGGLRRVDRATSGPQGFTVIEGGRAVTLHPCDSCRAQLVARLATTELPQVSPVSAPRSAAARILEALAPTPHGASVELVSGKLGG